MRERASGRGREGGREGEGGKGREREGEGGRRREREGGGGRRESEWSECVSERKKGWGTPATFVEEIFLEEPRACDISWSKQTLK